MAATALKISMLIDSLCPGGAQRQFVSLANGLKERGYEVTIFCYHENSFFRSALIPDIPVRVAVGKSGILRKIRILREFARTSADVAISFLDTPNFLNACLGIIFPQVRRIVSERNLDPDVLPWKKKVLFGFYRFVDRIVANSLAQTKKLSENIRIRHKVDYIVNMVDTARFQPSLEQREFTGPLKGLIIGRYTPTKNLSLLVEWSGRFLRPGVSFDWYGDQFLADVSPENNYRKMSARLDELSVASIRLHGPHSNTPSLYWDYDFFCLPSFHEGTPNVICEAMASGLPILCSDISDNSSLVTEGVNGFLFDPHSLKSFDQALCRLLLLTAVQRQLMSRVNRELATALFSKTVFLDRWERVITSQADSGTARRPAN